MSRADGRHVWMKRVSVRLGESSFDLVPLIAHDLRTPITAIKGLSQLALRRPDLPDSTAHYLEAVVEEANQIATLVDDLVLVRRIERGEISTLRSDVNLNALLRGVIDSANPADTTSRPIIVPTAEPVIVKCDPYVLTRAIVLLLVVAARHSRSNERVSAGIRRVVSGAEVWIATGSVLTSATERNGASSVSSATIDQHAEHGVTNEPNLSVFLATKLVEALGGQVLFEDVPGHGARFHVVLPEARGS
jgi:signal transduction histidine kinase